MEPLLCIEAKYVLHLQWGKKVFSSQRFVQVDPLKSMREVCHFGHRYTSTVRGVK